MESWDSELYTDIAKNYPILFEDTEGWTEEDVREFYQECDS